MDEFERSSGVIISLIRSTFAGAFALCALAGVVRSEPSFEEATHESVPLPLFELPDDLEISLWASSPLLYNPTNIDIDLKGRIWVAEGVRYRGHHARRPEGDRIVVLEDKDHDGKAESTHTFVQDPDLVAPLGVAVIDNKVVVSQPPHLLVYTDADRDLVFDADKGDTREILLTGFNGQNHDHSLHSVTVGPDGKWYFNSGNCGGMFTDKSGKTFRVFGSYRPGPIGPFTFPHDAGKYAGMPSDDGHTYVGGFTVRMNPDATDAEVIGHNYRNSYEQSVTSLGDVFQNDNDDPPACRVSWVMEYANFGFCSNDGQRSWGADQRPGQTTAIAEWRQEDPGSAPPGDVYGGGSPTGNVFYEQGALGDHRIGTFFACEPGRNTVFSYQPELEGAGFKLERHDFVTTNSAGEFAGSDFVGGNTNKETKTLFRPSDIAVGPDGALYISDWFDPRVGGHSDLDDTCAGAIYRIAPKGFKSVVPELDLTKIDGQIAALKSPAVNVRSLGFQALKKNGESSVAAVAELLKDSNPYIQGRAIHLLYQLGEKGIAAAGSPEKQGSPQARITAFRAQRRAGLPFMDSAGHLAKDADPAVRREAALAMRDQTLDAAKEILISVAKGYDGSDRSYLEALGTGATGKEEPLYHVLKEVLGTASPIRWSKAFTNIAWRLRPAHAVIDFLVRAKSDSLTTDQRKHAANSIAFVNTYGAAEAMMQLAAADAPLKAEAMWWLIHRSSNEWRAFDLLAQLKERGLYDPEKVELVEIVTPDPADTEKKLNVAEVLKLAGDVERGKATITRCIMCHQVGGTGIEVGPTLDGWGKNQTREVIANSIINPSSDISHGFTATEIRTTDKKLIHGLLLSGNDPAIIKSMGGVTQLVPADKIEYKRQMKRSLMLNADQLGLTAQDVADIVAFMKAN
ncbi:MAG: putative membrane-bound dehydrogenase-like protein [Verrucomicrobiales bacterium]|jgi:putative membrane-bound dehydrogenase-like protein